MFIDNLFLLLCYGSVFCGVLAVLAGASDWYYNKQLRSMARWNG